MTLRLWLGSCFVVLVLASTATSHAQQVGTCAPGRSEAFLDANQVRASIYNSGNLFSRATNNPNSYTVPKHGRAKAIFQSNLWIGGLVRGELRFAGSGYGPWEFFPGPLNESGALPNPADCSEYDRIYEVTVRDLERLDETGEATADIHDWPWHLGAPVADGDGDPENYDLDGGDRPEITGHQMLWWIMNDLGGPQIWGREPALGIEIQVSAFAVLGAGTALDHTTFYRYRITNKQSHPVDSTYFGFWVDADVGNPSDDYAGSDTTLGMAYFYNGDNDDQSHAAAAGYGIAPPAIGLDFVQGPRADSDGRDNDGDGDVDEKDERRGTSVFLTYNGDGTPQGNPYGAHEAYNYLRGIWRDGRPITMGGTGYGGDEPVTFMYPGDPVTESFWSELNVDERGTRQAPNDDRSLISTGPFRLEPNDTEEIVLAIVWARGDDYLDSVTELRKADRIAQDAWDSGEIGESEIPPRPAFGPPLASPGDEASGQPLDLTLGWRPQMYMSDYEIELAATPDFTGPSYRTFASLHTTVDVDSLKPFTEYFWRATGHSPFYESPASETRRFQTSDITLPPVGLQTIPGTDDPAYLEVRGPGGADPCGPNALSRDGCAETGGNYVYRSENSTGEYVIRADGGHEYALGEFAPNDFEIRFTRGGSYAYVSRARPETIAWVPFEVWDVGPVGFFRENDPFDDVQLIPRLFSSTGGECDFGYGDRIDHTIPGSELGWELSDQITAHYARADYGAWATAVGPLVEASADRCYQASGSSSFYAFIDRDQGEALRSIYFSGDPASGNSPGEGTIVRFYTTPPPEHSPIPAAPGDGTGPIEQPLELVWNAHDGNTTSQIQISSTATFNDQLFDAETTEESFVVSSLEEGQTFYWRVRLSHPESPWSDPWTFTAGEVTNVATQPAAELPTELTLDQNYPNPFNPSTTIRFGLPEAGHAQIVVYNLLGRRIATLVDGALTAGWHEVEWNAPSLGSGVYFYAIRTDRRMQTKSMVLMR